MGLVELMSVCIVAACHFVHLGSVWRKCSHRNKIWYVEGKTILKVIFKKNKSLKVFKHSDLLRISCRAEYLKIDKSGVLMYVQCR